MAERSSTAARGTTRTARGLGVAAILIGTAAVLGILMRLFAFRSAIFAFELHFTLMGAAALLDTLLAPALDSRRFDVSEREVRVYRALGALVFMRVLRAIGWTAALRDRSVFDGTRATLAGYERATRHGENAHAWLFVLVLAPIAWAAAHGWWDAVFWMGSMNVLFHVYPVMLQRSQRARLRRLIGRAGSR
ncbi:MAG: hypothetical protein HZA52_13415 [Planctomycetes bacterium]|nr:hypothetical protein [Planctomycetota bacterium]